jgi:uncharacterized membrane protein
MWALNFAFAFVVSGGLLVLAILRIVELSFAISFAVVLLGAGLIMYLRQRANPQSRPDERIRRIATRAMAMSWQLTVYGVVALYFLDYFKIFSLSSTQILTALVFFMSFSLLVFVLILRRLGDIGE